ncbi:MAG: nitroreductase [Clostridia bacterium]|nr:nitroreductase [Clostridia bacterium]
MKSCMEIMLDRRSTKKYKDTLPSHEDIDKIIEAGLSAASGRNMQASVIVAVTNKDIRDRLSRANAAVMGAGGDPFYNAPCVLVVLAEKTAHTYVYDGSLTLGNMMLAAHELGLGSCWIHRAKEVMYQPEWVEWIKSLGLEGEYEGIGNLVVGYPDGDMPAKKERREGRVVYVD